MARLVARHDWSSTPLGARDAWPASLKTAVQLVLASRYPMMIWWGRELIGIYNDAYARMTLGTRLEWALGRPAAEVFREAWHELGPRAESVFETGQATWDEELFLILERDGAPQETYHTFSYSPILGDDGAVAGLLIPMVENTAEVVGRRRLNTLRQLAARTGAEARTAEDACRSAAHSLTGNPRDVPFAMVYLLDADRLGARRVGMTGLPADSPAALSTVPVGTTAGDTGRWPLDLVMATGRAQVVSALEERFGPICQPHAPPVRQAVVLPIAKPGAERICGFLIVGVSPLRPLDDAYRGFLDLLAGHLATALANARAFEEERRRAEALAELDRAKSAFFSNVGHEFRTPLTLIRGPLELMLSGDAGEVTAAQREQLETLRRNAHRLQKLVNSMLEFARAEAGRMEVALEPVDLGTLTRELASAFASAIERAGLRLVVECTPLASRMYVDRELWEKIVLNLISNAIKFTFEGEIRVALVERDTTVELRVADTGEGIPQDELPRVFERFHRVAGTRARTQEGSGIGLALVNELVKLLGGAITVQSAVGKGTTFTVTLPRVSEPAAGLHTRAERPATASAAAASYVEEAFRWLPDPRDLETRPSPYLTDATLPPMSRALARRERVLLADDNADMRHYVRRLLEPHWHVDTVEDGAKALAAAQLKAPDLILADVTMAGLDGFELLKALRGDPSTSSVPVILLSARAGEEAEVEAMHAGADDYVVKPFGARELVARVAARLDIARQRRKSDEVLRGSEERMRLASEAARMFAWDVDLEAGTIQYSSNVAPIFGYDALPEDWSDLRRSSSCVHADDRARVSAALRRALRDTGIIEEEYRTLAADGSYLWLWSHGKVIRDPHGRATRIVGIAQDVTQRHRAEDALRMSEERMRLATGSAKMYAWEFDPESNMTIYSPNAPQVAGFEMPRDLKSLLALVHEEDRPQVAGEFRRAVREQSPFHAEYRMLHPKSGELVWLSSHGTFVDNPEGLGRRFVGISQNITERKRAGEERRRSSRNTQFVNQLDTLLSPLVDAEEIVSVAMRRLGEYLDVTRCYVWQAGENLVILNGDWRRPGMPSIAGTHPLDDAIPTAFRSAYNAGQSVAVADVSTEPMLQGVRERFEALDIAAFIGVPYVSGLGWEATVTATRDMAHDWRPDEVQLLRDVASRLWPAVKRARAERALRESEQRFRSMADSSPVMIWITDARRRIEFANRAFLDFFGIPTRERAAHFDWSAIVHPDDRDAYVDAFDATLRDHLPFQVRARVRRRDGAWRWVESRANPRLDGNGKATGMIGSSPDITEMFESQQALREADRRKDEFLAMLAHELRNPLAPIVNATRILRRLAPLGPELEGMREMIERQTDQLTTLVDDLLDVSRITQGRITLRKANVELMTVLARAIETSRPLIDSRHHHLAVALPTESVRIEGDVARLAQAISNLLNNSAKYTDDGGQIELKAEVESGHVNIRIKDNGIGIPPEDLARVFDLFTQADRSLDRSQGGLGIGLTVVKKLVEMHGGRVEAYSEGSGKGSEFVVCLPLSMAPRDERHGKKPPVEGPAKPAVRTRVLVVDDNVDSATSMSLLLKLDGHDVTMAHDGREALAVARAFLPQVILLDIGLPGMSGYEVARELRRDPAFANVTLIALTGYGQAEDRRRSKAAGFDHHLTKPVDDEALAMVLESTQGSSTTPS